MSGADVYQSSIQVPVSAMERLTKRAKELQCDKLQLARIMLALAREKGRLPDPVPPLESQELKVSFPFRLDRELVEELGGEDRARALLRWAIIEGIESSPFFQ